MATQLQKTQYNRKMQDIAAAEKEFRQNSGVQPTAERAASAAPLMQTYSTSTSATAVQTAKPLQQQYDRKWGEYQDAFREYASYAERYIPPKPTAITSYMQWDPTKFQQLHQQRQEQMQELNREANLLQEQRWLNHPLNQTVFLPNVSTNEQPFQKQISNGADENKIRQLSGLLRVSPNAVLRQAEKNVNRAYTQKQADLASEIARISPLGATVLSVGMLPSDMISAAQMAASTLFDRTPDTNAPAYMGTNFRKAMKETVSADLEAQYGKAVSTGYDYLTSVADALYGTALAGSGMEISSSAVNSYLDAIHSGLSPNQAAKKTALQIAMDAAGETGVLDDAVGAAVKKFGLMDTLVELGRKIPGAKKVIDEVEERRNTGIFKAGMELNDLNLTRAQEKDWVELNEHLYGFTDEELGKLAKLVEEGQSNLTITPWGDIIGETFGDDPRMFKTDLEYLPTSGVKLQATPGKTTTVLGRFTEDTGRILNELGNVKSTDLSGRTGGFNLLNTPDELYSELGGDRFWEMYNKPWLDQAIARDDIISLATLPNLEACAFYDSKLGKTVLTGFGKEYQYLLEHGYVYNQVTQQMVKGGG